MSGGHPGLHALVTVCALLALSTGSAVPGLVVTTGADVKDDDAGSGKDAGDRREHALALPGPGAYTGALRPHDRDWYVLQNGNEPACVKLDFHGAMFWNVTLAAAAPGGWVANHAWIGPADGRVVGAVAAPGVLGGFLGIEPNPLPSESNPARPGDYRFDLAIVPLGALAGKGDAGSGGDAGEGIGAVRVSDPCFAGSFARSLVTADRKDAYQVEAERGERLWYSLAHAEGAVASVRLVGPSGQTGPDVRSGGTGSYDILESGTWTLQVSLVDGSDLDYLVGFARDERPPGQSCRPYCLS